ncbi:hypothetical protein T10_7632, partial [Trichinella papuae]
LHLDIVDLTFHCPIFIAFPRNSLVIFASRHLLLLFPDMLTGTGCQRPKRHNCTNSFGRQAAGHNLAPTQQQGHFSC